jgi:hypothetical protein
MTKEENKVLNIISVLDVPDKLDTGDYILNVIKKPEEKAYVRLKGRFSNMCTLEGGNLPEDSNKYEWSDDVEKAYGVKLIYLEPGYNKRLLKLKKFLEEHKDASMELAGVSGYLQGAYGDAEPCDEIELV